MSALLLTFHKSGSQWVRDVLADPELLGPAGLTQAVPGLDLLRESWPQLGGRAFAGPLYNASREDWRRHRRDADRGVVVLRDPRDIAVSWATSFAISHVDNDYVSLVRAPLQRLDQRERLRLAFFAFYYRAAAFRSWLGEAEDSVLVVRYEKLLHDPEREFARVLGFFGQPKGALARIVERHSFEQRSGRTRGVEDVYSHFRKGVAGDWRRVFDRELGAAFEAAFPRLLVEAEYEASEAWWQALPEPAAPPEPTRENAALAEARRELARAREESRQLRRACDERLALIEQLHEAGQQHLRIIEALKNRPG